MISGLNGLCFEYSTCGFVRRHIVQATFPWFGAEHAVEEQ